MERGPRGSAALPRRAALSAGAAGVVLPALVASLGAAGSPAAFLLGAAAAGGVAATGGAALVACGHREGRAGLFRVLLGAAAMVWGAGQLLLAVLVGLGGAPFPTAGDALSAAAAPLAIAGLVLLPRRNAQPWRGLRLATEALMVGAVAAALLWLTWFRQVLLPDLAPADVMALVIVVADLSVLALVLICFAQHLDAGLGVTLAGVTLFVLADLVALHAVVQPGGTWSWPSAALACAAWPLITAGLLRVGCDPTDLLADELPRAESRRLLTVTAVLLALFAAFFASLLLGDRVLDPVTVALSALVVAGNAARELVNSRQNARLLEHFVGQAQRDALTGLANRWALTERLLALRSRPRPMTVLTLDLDGFKEVNGVLGHTVGDHLLTAVARSLEARCPDGVDVYRLGGDEFAVLTESAEDEACDLAESLRAGVGDAARGIPGIARIPLAVSVGVASVPAAGARDPLRTLADSGLALRLAKQSGRNRVERYSSQVAAADRRRTLVEGRLRRALAAGAIDVHFQPVVELSTGRLVGLEALARWEDAELGPVGPEEFVAVAESAGLIIDLGDAVLQRTLAVAAVTGVCDVGLNIGVNVSPLQLRVPGFSCAVAAALHARRVPPERLVVEVTESTCVSERDPAVAVLQDLVDLGAKIAIDDFGTGYSALGYLDRLPVHILKLDRSLVARLGDARTLAVARSISDLSSALGLDVVAEGIETREQERLAAGLGARFGQGWRWSAPLPPRDLPALLARTAVAEPASLQG